MIDLNLNLQFCFVISICYLFFFFPSISLSCLFWGEEQITEYFLSFHLFSSTSLKSIHFCFYSFIVASLTYSSSVSLNKIIDISVVKNAPGKLYRSNGHHLILASLNASQPDIFLWCDEV